MSNAGNVLRLRESLAGKFGERELRPQRFQAIMGDGTGAVSVPGKPNYVYIRRVGRGLIEECLNNKAAIRDGLPIIAGYSHESPEILQVLEVDWPSFSAPGDYSYIQHHHEAHELHNVNGGDDVVWVQSQQLMPLLVYPTDPATLFVNVFGGWYPWVGGWHYFESTLSATFAAHVPILPAAARYVLVSIDGATEALQYTPGATFPVFMPPADAENMVPAPPAGSIPIGAVYLAFGTTAIGWDELFDMRLFNQPVGGSVTPAPHALLDTTVHSDTATDAPSQGSLVIGNATPAWDELVHPGGAGGYALVSDAATFSWSLTPTWAGAHTFNAGLVVGAGQGITLPDPGWIGLGAALPRLTFTSGVPNVATFDDCGNVGIENLLYHIGDPDTYLIFSPDFAGFRVGGVDFLYMDENGADYFLIDPAGAGINVGIGTAAPVGHLEVSAVADPEIRISEGGSATSYSRLSDIGMGQFRVDKYALTGGLSIDFNPIAVDGVSAASFRFFRDTNTAGLTFTDFFLGDGTGTRNARVYGKGGSTYFCDNNGNFGITNTNPGPMLNAAVTARLQVGGNIAEPIYMSLKGGANAEAMYSVENDARQYRFGILGDDRWCLFDDTANALRIVISVAGAMQWPAYGAGTLTTDAAGNITAVSDMRLKEQVRNTEIGLAEVLRLQGKAWHYTKESGLDTEYEYLGFIADDIEKIVPQAVGRNADGMRTLNLNALMPAFAEAFREIDVRLAKLEAT